MGRGGSRLDPALIERVESFCDRVVHVCRALQDGSCHRRIVEQLVGCGTSVGANCYEADEALSRADFARTLGIVVKELNETVFWLRLVGRRGWVDVTRPDPLVAEARELKSILGAMIWRTRHPQPPP